ncbi:hypothetical protein NL676_006852 [Syzygium grande]|nr:hypothetical protein NL676_006852 [Syzygium grande]
MASSRSAMLVVVLLLMSSICYKGESLIDGLLPNGNFEYGLKPWQTKGTVVTDGTAIPNWEISGYVEYIKSGQKQGDMLLVVPEGNFAVRLGNEAAIKQKVNLIKGSYYAVTFAMSRTCAQDEKLNVSVSPNSKADDWGILPVQTMYSSNGWDSYAWSFQADGAVVDISFRNPGIGEDPACGPLIDLVALKTLNLPKRTPYNLVKNGNFEEGPYIFPNSSCGVLIPPHVEDDHSPIPGWTVESLKAVKYVDSDHFAVPEGRRAVELVAGRESAVSQAVLTIPGRAYVLTFAVGDAGDSCEGRMQVEAYAGRDGVRVPYESRGKGGSVRAELRFVAAAARTRVMFLSSYYATTSDHSGSLCGPVVDDVKLLSVRCPK